MHARTPRAHRHRALSAAALFGAVCIAAAGCSSSQPSADEVPPDPAAESAADAAGSPAPVADDAMRVTLLGTGSPVPSPERLGNSTLVQAGGLNLVFDAGRGASIRLTQAGVPMGDIDGVFLTHFHSDHVNGLADLWLTGFIPAFGGRDGTFDVYGPVGVEHIIEGLAETYRNDISSRVADGEVDPDTTHIVGHDFPEDGIVFDRNGVTVTMFDVEHDPKGAIRPSVGYRVDYAGNSVLISGDTVPVDSVLHYGDGVDVLIHEVAAFADPSQLQNVFDHHTSPQEAGKIFTETDPAMAVYSHIVNGIPGRVDGVSTEELVEQTREEYSGPLTVGNDLDTFLITADGVATAHVDTADD